MTDIYLIRHTTPQIDKGICYGKTDLALANSFQDELKTLKSKVNQEPNLIWTSPAQRCQLLAQQLSDNVVKDERLWEMDFGDWEMQTWDEIPPKDLQNWMDDFANVQVPNGESFQMVLERVVSFWEAVQPNLEKYASVAIVAHAGSLRALLTHILEMPLQKAFVLDLSYGSVSLLKVKNDYHKLAYLNK